eukprot:tig00000073_g1725.t1
MATANLGDDVQEAVDALDRTSVVLQKLEVQLDEVLADEAISSGGLAPLDAAKYHVLMAYTLSSCFFLYLKAIGTKTKSHRIMHEIKRVQEFKRRIDEYERELSGEKEAPLTSLNLAAANRFILHSVPDLTEEQKSALKDAIADDERSKKRSKRGEAAAAAAGAEEESEAAGPATQEASVSASQETEEPAEEAEASPAKAGKGGKGGSGRKSAGKGKKGKR